jgi:hypothetical protein
MRKVILAYDFEIEPGIVVPAGTQLIADPTLIGMLMRAGLITREIGETQMMRPVETRAYRCGLN